MVKDGISNDYEAKSKWISTTFIFIGLIMIIYLLFSPQHTDTILGIALTTIGLLSSYLTAKLNPKVPVSWSKSLLIFFTGIFFLFLGLSTLTSIGLLIGLFFLFGTGNNLLLAYKTRKEPTRYAWLIHAFISGFFAFDILLNTATLSSNTIGLYVAINLISDGLVVLYSGRTVFIRP